MLTDSDANIMEVCFHNGERHMKEKVIKALRNIQKMYFYDADTIDYILEMMEGL